MRPGSAGFLLLGLSALAIALAGSASAGTPILNSTVDTLYVLEVAGSPYTLGHDLHVAAGGFLLVSEGTELYIDNGSRLIGDGGSISATGTLLAPAVIKPTPASNFTTWGGIELNNGSTLTLRNARIESAVRGVTFQGIGNLDAQFVAFVGCAEWCVQTNASGTLALRDSTMSGGAWGLKEMGSGQPSVQNVTFADFSGGGMWFGQGSSAATVAAVRIVRSAVGVFADHLSASTFAALTVEDAVVAVDLNVTSDVTIHNSTLHGANGTGVRDRLSARLAMRDTQVDGSVRALAFTASTAASVATVRASSPTGSCLYLLNVTNAVFRSTRFDLCRRTLEVDPLSAPPTADADRSNTVDGRPVVWISNAAGVRVDVRDNPGLVVVSAVTSATLSDLRLHGAGVHIFGSSQVVVERIFVEEADAAVVAIGTRDLTIRQLAARNVTTGIRVWSSAFFPPAQEVWIENVRIDGAGQDGISVTDATTLTVLRAYARAAGSALRVSHVSTALIQYGYYENSTYGARITDTTDATVVDNVFADNVGLGMLASNTTGYAARNAFVGNADHASTPASPTFPLFELGGGNYWSGFTAPNVNGDLFYDTPYNTTDLTGQDQKPRVGRLDFRPTVIVAPPGVLEVGEQAFLDGSLTFDDFQVATIYWTVVMPYGNVTGSGPVFPFPPNAVGNFTVIVEAQDSILGVNTYSFKVVVEDSKAPTLGPLTIGRPEIGGNLTVSLNATDNDPAFPEGMGINWTLTYKTDATHTVTFPGTASNLSFEIPISALGPHNLTVVLTDRSGNFASAQLQFNATDTTPPEVEFDVVGLPDLGLPFKIDASTARDPLGVNASTAFWQWADAGELHNSTAWPAVNITFLDTGNHTVNFTICDTAGNCGVTQITLDARDRTPPQLSLLRVIVPNRDAVEIHPGENPVVPVEINKDIVFEIVGADPSQPLRFTWNFGDGTTAEGSNVVHRFTAGGTAVVTVTITDSAGNANTTAVRVNAQSSGIFDINTIPGGLPGLIVIIAILGGGIAGLVFLFRYRRKHQKVD